MHRLRLPGIFRYFIPRLAYCRGWMWVPLFIPIRLVGGVVTGWLLRHLAAKRGHAS